MKYIFLCGVHGVGKSTVASRLKKFIDIQTLSVSDLIRRAGKELNTSKNTDNIQQNQDLWKNELLKLDINESILLLDGHFCLLDVAKNRTPLPFSTFEGTNMIKIIFIKNDPIIIRERLLKRDSQAYSIELLEDLQDCEQKQALKYSAENNIDLFIYEESQALSELVEFITT